MIDESLKYEMIDYLKGLSDREYQEEFWVLKRKNSAVENDELDYTVHFFFDDTELADNPHHLTFCARTCLLTNEGCG